MTLKKMVLCGAMMALLAAGSVPAASLSGLRVAVLPFRTNSEKDLAYLREGAAAALSTRMGRLYDLEIVPRRAVQQLLGAAAAPSSDADARKAGQLLGADFILLGSVTVIGGSISVDSRLVAVAGERPTAAFFAQAEESEGLFPQLDRMAQEIHSALTGRAPVYAAAQPPAARRAPGNSPPAGALTPDSGAPEASAAHSGSIPPSAASEGPAPAAAKAVKVPPPGEALQAPTPAPAPREPVAAAPNPPAAAAPLPRPAVTAREQSTTPSGGSAGFTIQVAAMQTEAAANAMLARLLDRGYEARIETADLQEKGRWLRLRVGSFPSRAAAEPTLQQLKSEGYAPMLFPEQPALAPKP